ncbi:MAG: hypothetical protein A2583_12810 [Bdellovibrionales bacterium RIFOXYD1_FULL_53_11]|nr:MAG: hypothetical protein A2583_12810 [Bdellovibrionales bacterium RIFOXYD1_FULL_53_11]
MTPEKPAVPVAEKISTTTKDGAVLEGVWLKQPGNPAAPVAVVNHGVLENTRMMDPYMRELHRKGYQVMAFNFRGHGDGSATSGRQHRFSKPPKNHPVTFDRIAAYDIDAIVDKAIEVTGQKNVAMHGHSMGGMSASAYLEGVTYKNGKLILDDTLSGVRQLKVRSLVMLGSPPHIDDLKGIILKLLTLDKHTQSIARSIDLFNLPKRLNEVLDYLESKGSMHKALAKKIEAMLGKLASVDNPVSGILFHPENFKNHPDDFIRMLRHGISPASNELMLKNFGEWAKAGTGSLKSATGEIDFAAHYGRIKIPVTFIAGEHDVLAPAEKIYRDFYLKIGSRNKRFIVVKAGHLDLVRAAGLQGMKNVMHILDDPEALRFHFEKDRGDLCHIETLHIFSNNGIVRILRWE